MVYQYCLGWLGGGRDLIEWKRIFEHGAVVVVVVVAVVVVVELEKWVRGSGAHAECALETKVLLSESVGDLETKPGYQGELDLVVEG